MNITQKKRLLSLNQKFYLNFAQDFALTRQGFWTGFERLTPLVKKNVLDIACGNLRFKKFLDTKQIAYQSYLGIDANLSLLQSSKEQENFYQQIEILETLEHDGDWRELLRKRISWESVFCLAFFHHVPSKEWREKFILQLWSLVAKGGFLTVSFWQFAFLEEGRKLIVRDLGDNDFLLAWGGQEKILRYCHHFSDKEINYWRDILVKNNGEVAADFCADGKSGKMNRYLVWKKA